MIFSNLLFPLKEKQYIFQLQCLVFYSWQFQNTQKVKKNADFNRATQEKNKEYLCQCWGVCAFKHKQTMKYTVVTV